MLLLCYYFDEKYGVAAQRSRSLWSFLSSKNIPAQVVQLQQSSWGWLFKSLKSIIRTNDTIYVSCGPFYPLLLISFWCFICRKKLIVDLRDPWSLSIIYGYGKRTSPLWSFKAKIALWIEHFAYKHSQEMWVCTQGMYQFYEKYFRDSKKLRMIPNGYDGTLLTQHQAQKKNDLETERRTYICLGKFVEYGFENCHRIIKKIMDDSKQGNFKILLVGCEPQANRAYFEKFYPEIQYQICDRVSYLKALQMASECDYGICLVRNEDYEYGTKVFDYIYLKLPILDIFDQNKNFYLYFKDYLEDPEKVDRKHYDRQVIWESALAKLLP